MTVAEFTLTGADAARQARTLVGQVLHDSVSELVEDASLVVSELVTNAQLHGAPPVTLRVMPLSASAGVRIEVEDASQRMLVLPTHSLDAMTGRGLALVGVLSVRWGVTGMPSGRKVVWAELEPGATSERVDPEVDVDAFLEAWADDQEQEFTVRLGAVPTDLLLDAKRHIDNVVRELTLESAGGAELPPAFRGLVDTVTGDFAAARMSIKEQAAAAAARGDRETNLVMRLPASSSAAGERYLAALDEADRYARAARLLTLETPSLHRLFRRWYVQSLVEQLRRLSAGETAVEPLPFVQVLTNEVASLTARPTPPPPPPNALPFDREEPQVWVGGAAQPQLLSLTDAARAIAGANSVEELLEVVTEAARAIIGTHQAVGTRLYGGTWEQAATYVSLSEDYARYRDYEMVPKGLGVLNVVTRENRPLRLTHDELVVHPEFRGLRDAPGHPPLPDYLAAPFYSRHGDNIGLLQLSHKIDETDFTEADEAVCVQLALLVSAALEHVELARALETALKRAESEQEIVNALHEVGRAATSSLEHADVVQVVTDAATAMTGAQFGAFFYNVIGERGESYALYTISGVPREAFSKFPMPRNTEIFGPTFNGEGVVRLDDVTADPRYGRLAPHHGMPKGHLPVRSYLAVPVKLSDGEVIGGLFFGHEDVGVFGDNAERLAVGIAAYAAIALENGRLYDAARRESREKEAVAAALERPLQPPELPEIPGVELAAVFRPFGGTGQLGGDFYDVFPLGRERWVLALGDVAGKGPEAAAITGLVRHTLWGAAQFAADPASVAAAVNANLFRQSSERFATLVVAVLTPGPDAVTVDAVWAGHPPALLVGREGDRIVHADGVPIGMFSELRLGPVRLVLQPGEMLLVYTDGLLERQGAVLNEQAVLDAVHAQQQASLDAMLEQVVAEIGAEFPARDDVAAVALRVRPPS